MEMLKKNRTGNIGPMKFPRCKRRNQRKENGGREVGNVNKKDFMKGHETKRLETSQINNRLKV